jgi:hypothetical protein
VVVICHPQARSSGPALPCTPHRKPEQYARRRPERTALYKIIARHFETWLAERSLGEHPVAVHVEEEFRAYLRCGILSFGFARARCGTCGHDFLVAFSCKGRGVCPSCNGRRMAQAAAHLVDHVIPPVPVRQWVISVPKRLRWHLAERPEAVSALTNIFISEVERLVQATAGVEFTRSEQAAHSRKGTDSPRIGAVSFLHRFGSALNHHVHLHACITDGVFCRTATSDQADASVAFLPSRPITPADLEALTERVRRRLIRWYKRRGFLDAEAAADLLAWNPSGFSIDASVRISLDDRDVPSFYKSLEHLLRYCARPAFAIERLAVIDGRDGRPDRVCYTLPRHKRGQWIGRGRTQKSTTPDMQGVVNLSATDLLDRLTDLVPPPRKHRHRYHGVFAPHHPLRPLVTAMAIGNVGRGLARFSEPATKKVPVPLAPGPGQAAADAGADTEPQKRSHDTSRIAWAKLLAKIAEAFPLVCPVCGGDIRLIAFIVDPGPIRKILAHVGEPVEPPPVSPARGPPTEWTELVQAHDDRDVMQASPDELPVIDIHSL